MGKGGAIYFGENTAFSLLSSNFTECSAVYGGAIYSGSELTLERQIKDVVFVNNAVSEGGNGNDIADNSSVGSLLYNVETVTNSVSNSDSHGLIYNFFIIQGGFSYDCLLSSTSDSCHSNPLYVSVKGSDYSLCGFKSSPCYSISQGLKNLELNNDVVAEIDVMEGNYTNTMLVFEDIAVSLMGDEDMGTTLSLVEPPKGLYYYLYISLLFFFLFFFLFSFFSFIFFFFFMFFLPFDNPSVIFIFFFL
jgi:predicted outer membrane repeat protein